MDINQRLKQSDSMLRYYQNVSEDKEKKRRENISLGMKAKWKERKNKNNV